MLHRISTCLVAVRLCVLTVCGFTVMACAVPSVGPETRRDDGGPTVVAEAGTDAGTGMDSAVPDTEAGAGDDAASPDGGDDGGPFDDDGGLNTDGGGASDGGANGGGCPDGFTGTACERCEAGRFGPQCLATTCVHGTCGDGTCAGVTGTGTCDSCEAGWMGDNCDSCVGNRAGDNCEACAEGWAGDGCDVCDDSHFGAECLPVGCVNGQCPAGACSGLAGNGQCTSCDDNWAGEHCDTCIAGRFGANCDQEVTCDNGTCEPGSCSGPGGNGQCTGCDANWAGANCDECATTHHGDDCELPVTCVNGTCEAGSCYGLEGNGECDSCQDGWGDDNCDECDDTRFGVACQSPVTCENGECDDGSCYGFDGNGLCDECDRGWLGDNCNVCDETVTFGASCALVTCENGTCGAGTCSGPSGDGTCDACDDGWMGDDCDQQCFAFEVESCYDGPQNTVDVGICRAGYRVCHESGKYWSPCFDQVQPLAVDVCGNGLDDNCSGAQTDESCVSSGSDVWVDGDNGNDDTGDGTPVSPYATIAKALESNRKLIVLQSDGDGTTYSVDLNLGGSQQGTRFLGVGPTRPTLSGTIRLGSCRRCAFENVVLEYPNVGPGQDPPGSMIDGVHNYDCEFRNVKFSAPHGLPPGASLYDTHHGYDNLFVDVEVDDVVLAPTDASSNVSYTLLNAADHGTGSQFTRVTLGSVSVKGPVPDTLNLTLLAAWGYCDQLPDGVTAVRNVLATGLDMTGMATSTTRFEAMELGCYLAFDEPAGFLVLNNTMADITATETTFLNFRLSTETQTLVSGNIVGPVAATSSTGVNSSRAAGVFYSNFFGLTAPVTGSATLETGMLNADPGFVGGGNYRLDTGSVCIDAGDPQLLDGDASRSDMGAYGGPQAAP